MTTVPFLHRSLITKADDSLSKGDCVPWIGTVVIITKIGDPFKEYTGVVKDILCGQDTASGLKIVLQLECAGFSTTFKKMIADYDDVVEKMSVKNLHLHQYLINAFFKDWISTFRLCKTP